MSCVDILRAQLVLESALLWLLSAFSASARPSGLVSVMAVTADFLFNEDSEGEDAHPESRRNGSGWNPVSAAVTEDVDVLQDSGAALSDEALILLKRASRSLVDRKRRSSRSVLAPLYRQLESLRNLVPYTTPAKRSCVVMDGLDYLEQLKQEIEDLQSSLDSDQDHAVQVTNVNKGLRVRVYCEKRPGLLADLMMVLETFGLVLDDVKVSCHHILSLDVFTSLQGVAFVDKESITKALRKAIDRKVTIADAV